MATKEIQQTPPSRPKGPASKENILKKTWNETVRYLKGVNSELKRVTWPTPKELRYNTIVVVFVVIGISGYMWLVDQALSVIFRWFHQT